MKQNTSIEKLCLILPDLSRGGAQRMLLNMAQYYADQGIDTTLIVLTNKGDSFEDARENKSLKLIVLNGSRVRKNIWKLVAHLKEIQPTVVFSALSYVNILTIIAARLAGLKKTSVIVSERAFHSINAKLTIRGYQVQRLLIRVFYPLSNQVVAISRGVAEDIRKVGRLKDDQVTVIYNPVIRKDFPNLLKQPLRNDALPDGRIIVTCGRLVKVKDYPTLIKAFAALSKNVSDVSLVIIGDGALKSQLIELTRNLAVEDKIYFIGFVANPLPFFEKANVFALTSLSEGFGNVIVEAMYTGTHVVSTDCPSGPREILEDGKYGVLVPVGDVQTLANALEGALSSPLDSALVKKRAMDFEASAICEQYLAIAKASKA